ncbi:LPS-assembly protein LptD [bacterium]|nr:LPS-assembly protein LptD [bacterium]
MITPVSVLLFMCVFLPISITAQSVVTINADLIDYSNDTESITANTNVKLQYRSYTSSSDLFFYNTKSLEGVVSGSVVVTASNQLLRADKIVYNGTNLTGEINNINAIFGKYRISGKTAKINPAEVIVDHATFTSCDGSPPDYLIQSERISLYPQWGVMVAFNNWVSVKNTPILWLPTFIFGSKDYSLLASNSSIPEFGANAREGAYIRQRLGYFINPKNTGAATIGYSSNWGGVARLNNLYRFSDTIYSQLGLGSNGSDGFDYSAIITIDLADKPQVSNDTDNIWDSLSIKNNIPPIKLSAGTKYREYITDSRVSNPFFIDSTWTISSFLFDGITSQGTSSLRRVDELTLSGTSVQSGEIILDHDLFYNFAIFNDQKIRVGGIYKYRGYDLMEWQRGFAQVAYSLNKNDQDFTFSYSQRLFSSTTESPFEFERKYALQGSEIGIQYQLINKQINYGVELNFDLEASRCRTFDIVISPKFHCWKVPLRWKSVEGTITFGIELE